jgi:hypothetical protein
MKHIKYGDMSFYNSSNNDYYLSVVCNGTENVQSVLHKFSPVLSLIILVYVGTETHPESHRLLTWNGAMIQTAIFPIWGPGLFSYLFQCEKWNKERTICSYPYAHTGMSNSHIHTVTHNVSQTQFTYRE